MKTTTTNIILEGDHKVFTYRIVRNPKGFLASSGETHMWELHIDNLDGEGYYWVRTYDHCESTRKAIQRGVRYADEIWFEKGYPM